MQRHRRHALQTLCLAATFTLLTLVPRLTIAADAPQEIAAAMAATQQSFDEASGELQGPLERATAYAHLGMLCHAQQMHDETRRA
jgi:hypothetical protein